MTDASESDSAVLHILCTNDDGVHAPGLTLLEGVAAELGVVTVVAPDRQQSASSHSLTLHRPLRVVRAGERRYAVDGTPTDCVLVAVNRLMDSRPRLVISGVNHGPNMGEDVLYSGTVAAAMEGTILGIPAVAISYAGRRDEWLGGYGPLLAGLLRTLLAASPFPPESCFNINLPELKAEAVRGVRVTTLGRRVYSDTLTRREDPMGREYYWIGGGVSKWSGRDDSDFRAVKAGYVSVTPLHLDLTDYRFLEEARGWKLGE